MSDKTTLEMQTEYEQALASKAKAISSAIESVCTSFNRLIEKSSPSASVPLGTCLENSLREVKSIFQNRI